jgi:chromosome segregation ATPase
MSKTTQVLGYKLPPAPGTPGTRNPSPVDEQAAARAAKADRRAQAQRERTAPRRLSTQQRARLRALARHAFDLEQRTRAFSASNETIVDYKRECGRRRAVLEQQLPTARSELRRFSRLEDSQSADDRALFARQRDHVADLEQQIAELDADIESAVAEQASLHQQAQEVIAALAPLRETVNAVCARFNLSPTELGASFTTDVGHRRPADIVVR